jgi:hypothetical protein
MARVAHVGWGVSSILRGLNCVGLSRDDRKRLCYKLKAFRDGTASDLIVMITILAHSLP